MGLKLIFDARISEYADMRMGTGDLVHEEGLETIIIMCLGTDRRVPADESPDGDPHGSWSDDLDPDYVGLNSKLWLLERARLNRETLKLAEQYTVDALKILVDNGVASDIIASAEKISVSRARVSTAIVRPKGDILKYQYIIQWDAQEAA